MVYNKTIMPRPESPREEINPATPEFEFDPNGVGLVVEAAIGKLVEVARAGDHSPMKPDGITFDLDQAGKNIRARAQARTMAHTLDLIVTRTDGRTWEEVLEAQAAEREASSDSSSASATE